MWTKLKDTELWKRAETAYAAPEGRHYHNMGHVMRLYEVAEETAVPYDRALDLAILAHDAIYDEKPQRNAAAPIGCWRMRGQKRTPE